MDIVCRPNVKKYYGKNAELVEKYKAIEEKKECPFCPENIGKEGRELIAETAFWSIIKNQYPYKGTDIHLLIVPKRHLVSLSEISALEWVLLPETFKKALEKYPFLDKGYGLALRVGQVGGVTLYHLHWHLIVPETGKKGQIAVNFGIG